MTQRFTGQFTQPDPLDEESIAAAVEVMRSGRLHRYTGEASEVAALERDCAALLGSRYALAVASGGQALALALRAVGIGPGDRVLMNAWTLAPVPGAIAGLGAEPVFVETDANLRIDLGDLERKLGDARVLLLSHMRGHVVDMDRLMALCRAAGVTVIEDCAHTMGATWAGTPTGRFGAVGCFSTQTYKHANSGEGGLVITDDPDLAARMVLMSGSYMLYDRHGAAPTPQVFARHRLDLPNLSCRMDNLRAAVLRPQLRSLPQRIDGWRARYQAVARGLDGALYLPQRPQAEGFVPSSIQFFSDDPAGLVDRCAARGVELKWFGAPEPHGFTSRYDSWRYAAGQRLPQTDRVLAGLLDMRLPLAFSLDDCALIARIIREEAGAG